jgi:hypothetical protein
MKEQIEQNHMDGSSESVAQIITNNIFLNI